MTELADRLSRHADLHEHQPWADDEQMQFARDLREAVGLIADLARLRSQVPVGWIGPSGFTHNTATNRMWMRESPKLAAKLSPVYAAPPAQPVEPRNPTPQEDSVLRAAARRSATVVDAGRLVEQPAEPVQPGWRDIESAPKDGSKILLAKYGWSNDAGDAVQGSDEWKRRILDQTRRKYGLWWCVAGHWSARWNNWNDGVEPSGLAGPTHWMPLPPAPKATK